MAKAAAAPEVEQEDGGARPRPRHTITHDHDHDHDHAHDHDHGAKPATKAAAKNDGDVAKARERLAAAGRNDPLPVRLGEEIQEVPPRRRRAGDGRAARRAGRQGAADRTAGVCSSSGARAPPRRSSAPRWTLDAEPAGRARRHRHGAPVGRQRRRRQGRAVGACWPRARRRSPSCARRGQGRLQPAGAAALHPGGARARLPRLRRGALRGRGDGSRTRPRRSTTAPSASRRG